MEVDVCRYCKTIYVNGRPLVCDNCKSNVFFEKTEIAESEIEEIKNKDDWEVKNHKEEL